MSTVILYSKNDAKEYLFSRPSADRVLPLTPNAMAELVGKIKIPILDPVDYFTDYGHRRVLARVRSIERELYPLLYNNSSLSNSSKETFRGMFHSLACKIFYLWYSIRDVGPWIIRVGNDWKRENHLIDAHNLLCKEIHLSGKGLFNGSFYLQVKKKEPYLPAVTKVINFLLFKIMENRKCIFITGRSGAFENVQKKLKDQCNDFCLVQIRGAVDLKAIIFSLLKLLQFLLNRSKYLTYLIIPKPQSITKNFTEFFFGKLDDFILKNVNEIIKESIEHPFTYTETLYRGISSDYYIKKIKDKTLFAHELRLLESSVIGEFAKTNKFRSILVSHGSHPYTTNTSANYAHKENARGLLTSPLATITIAQSPSAEKTAKYYMSTLKREKYQPILWGYNKISKRPKIKNNIRTILHAGTTNKLNGRPWIYETSNEFVTGLKLLVHEVDKLNNAQLIIRIRPNLEWSIDSLKKLLPNSAKYRIKIDGSFLEDLQSADLLISFSSTTIEESLYARRPVGLFGGSERYYHFDGSSTLPTKNNRHAVYQLTKHNLGNMLNAILESHKGSLLTDDELRGYIWPRTVPNYNQFLNYLLN